MQHTCSMPDHIQLFVRCASTHISLLNSRMSVMSVYASDVIGWCHDASIRIRYY